MTTDKDGSDNFKRLSSDDTESAQETPKPAATPEVLQQGAEKLNGYFQKYVRSLELYNAGNIPMEKQNLQNQLYFLCLDIRENKEPSILKRIGISNLSANIEEYVTAEDIAEEERIMALMIQDPDRSIPIFLQSFANQRADPENEWLNIPHRGMALAVAKTLNIEFPLNPDAVENSVARISGRTLEQILQLLMFETGQDSLVANLYTLQAVHGKTEQDLKAILENIGIAPDIARKRIKQTEAFAKAKSTGA